MSVSGQINSTAVRASVLDYVALFRPAQWIKNVVVFAAPAAGLKLFSLPSFFQAFCAFGAFCLASSASYAINDVVDRHADARHPVKRNRPVASGQIAPGTAVGIGGGLFVLAVALSSLLPHRLSILVVVLYFTLTMAYSLGLKNRMILDVIVIATGFVLRAWAGSLAVDVKTSAWLVACMFTLCLFLGFGKRRCEVAMIADPADAKRHRSTLIRYTPDLLNHLITVSAGIAVMTFLLYTMDVTYSPAPFPKQHLFYTLPLVVYGVFRFAMITELGLYSGPTEIVLKDIGMRFAIASWAVVALVIVYQNRLFGEGGLEGFFRKL